MEWFILVKGKFFAFKGPREMRKPLGNGCYTIIPSDYRDFDVAKGREPTTPTLSKTPTKSTTPPSADLLNPPKHTLRRVCAQYPLLQNFISAVDGIDRI
jgi:hypothetical protein